MDYTSILQEVYTESQAFASEGKVADYIPELSKINPDQFGIFLQTKNDQHFELGNSLERFSIQSISKVFTLSMLFLF